MANIFNRYTIPNATGSVTQAARESVRRMREENLRKQREEEEKRKRRIAEEAARAARERERVARENAAKKAAQENAAREAARERGRIARENAAKRAAQERRTAEVAARRETDARNARTARGVSLPKNTATYSPQNNAANPVKEMIDALGRNKQINKTVKLEPIKQVERVRDTAKRDIDNNPETKALQIQHDMTMSDENDIILKGEQAAAAIMHGYDTPENRAAVKEHEKLQSTRAQLNNNIESIKSEAYKKAVGDEVAAVDNSMLNDANAARAIETGKK
ncbi:MAG: hypothetical protein RR632_07230, partial [Christensenella sp.]